MKISRLFTRGLQNPYADQVYETRHSEIRESDGSSVFRLENVTVPRDWSQTATDILAQKYFRKGPAKESGCPAETDARQVFHRLAGCWTDWGKRYRYFDSDEDARAFYDEIAYMLAHQIASPNSPQWFNTGVAFAYGLLGDPQGHWYVDPDSDELKPATSSYERPQAHACFIQSVADDLVNPHGIFDLWVREARVFKFGSGSGTNFSSLRGRGEPVKGGGASSGLMSFLRVGDAAAAAIQSGGTTRRAAKMVCLDLDHPEIEAFIDWKIGEEGKVAALVAGSRLRRQALRALYEARAAAAGDSDEKVRAALSAARAALVPEGHVLRTLWCAGRKQPLFEETELNFDWRGEAYLSVSGQNSNNSVRVPNRFFRALEEKGTWGLRGRMGGKILKEISAAALWERIAFAAWACADPGLHFQTTIDEWHTCPAGGPIRSSNPCSEYLFLDDTGCNLASLNLLKFLDEQSGELRLEPLAHACRLWTVVLEISVLMAQFPSREIARNSHDYRTLGLGYANLGALLMSMGLAYGEPRAQSVAGALTAILCAEAYATSSELAREHGPFKRFAENRDSLLRVLRNHRRAAKGVTELREYEGLSIAPRALSTTDCPEYLRKAAGLAWDRALALAEKHGVRNAQVTAIAPTGTIGLLMDCDTMGIEPEFALVKGKRLAGGGYLRILNQSLPRALAKLGYSTEQMQAIRAHCLGHGTLKNAPHINPQTLSARGLNAGVLQELESAIPRAWDIDALFVPAFGASKTLRELGFTESEIAEADRFIFGERGFHGAPHLKPEHFAVFDCAQACGRHGTRALSWPQHLAIMAAAQPFLSGGIAKTVNLPASATPRDVQDAYHEAWRLGIKAVAVYRDGSKLSQPLLAERAPAPSPIPESPVCVECG